MKHFIDTEFYDDGEKLHLISIGVKSENGSSIYIESDFDIDAVETKNKAQELNIGWLKANVVPHLSGNKNSKESIREGLLYYFNKNKDSSNHEFWLYYGAWDWILFVRAISEDGMMMGIPRGFNLYYNEIMQLGKDKVKDASLALGNWENAHDALADAEYQKAMYDYIVSH